MRFIFVLTKIALVSILLTFTACQNQRKAEDRPGVAGNAYTDGLNIFSGGYINGQYIQVQVSDFNPVYLDPNSYVFSGTGFTYSPYLNFNGLYFVMSLNGSSGAIETPFVFAPIGTAANSAVQQMNSATFGSFDIRYQARCVNNECEPYYLNIVISQNNFAKQLGLKRSRTQNRTLSVIEAETTLVGAKSTDQLISDLNILK